VVEGIALPPAFEYLPAFFPPDADHARLAAFVRRHQRALGGGPLELGDQGRTAPETVEHLCASRVERVIVVDAHPDPSGATFLLEALAARAIPALRASELAVWRTLPGAPLPPPRPSRDGAPWSARYGLDQPHGETALRARAARERPELLPWVEAVIDFQRLAVHPLAELYGGNGLLERNAAYLVNLAP
jgi:hypothetical protein